MEVGNIKVKVGADTQGLHSGLSSAEQRVRQFGATVSQATNKSKSDFTNFGRVIQDLPFGFMGIQNNLTQLIPSVGAFGLAFSAVTAAITFAQVGFGAWTRGLDGASDKTKKAKDELKDFADGLRAAETGARKTGLELQAYVNIARDGEKPLAERNYALAEANKILGEHGEKLTLVNINTKEVTEQVNNFTKALIGQAVASKYSERIAEITIKNIALKKSYNELQNALASTEVQRTKLQGGMGYESDYERTIRKINNVVDEYNANAKEMSGLTLDMNGAIEESASLFGQMGTKAKDSGRNIKTIADIMRDLGSEMRKLATSFDGNFITQLQYDDKLVEAYQKAIEGLADINTNDASRVITDLLEQIQPLQSEILKRKFADYILKHFKEAAKFLDTISAPIEIVPVITMTESQAELANLGKKFLEDMDVREGKSFGINLGDFLNITQFKEKLEEAKKSFAAFKGNIQQMMTDLKAKLISSVAEGIGNALATGNIKGLFSGIFQTLAQGLKQMGEAMIQYGAGIIILKKAIKNPYLAIAAGVGLVALSSVLQAKVPKFAKGGMVTGPTLSMLGDNPSGKEAIIPFERMGEFVNNISGKGGGDPYIVSYDIKGQDLRLVLQRANQSYSRGY